jgi:hypothetical protein
MAAAKMSTKTAWLITAAPPTDDPPRYHDGTLKDQPRRFNQLRRLVPGITQRMLTLQLRALEQDAVVARTVHNSVPPHVEYSFTRRGDARAHPRRRHGGRR